MAGALSDDLLQKVRRVAERQTVSELRVRLAQRAPVIVRVLPAKALRAEPRASVIVVDTSAVIEVLLNTPVGSQIAGRLFAAGHAPRIEVL